MPGSAVMSVLKVTEVLQSKAAPDATLTLPFDQRQNSRFRACLDSGEEVGLLLPRGTTLRGGDLLRAEDGRVIRVAAAAEDVMTVHGDNPRQLAVGAYHLGNRHVPVQVGEGWLRFAHDHVLEDMLRGLGLSIEEERAPFEPENGAYGSHGSHRHAHSHD